MRLSQPTRLTTVVVRVVLAVALQIVASAQTAPLPPAYPRPGTTLMFENPRVLVWNISWLKQQYALHRHPYDLVGVYLHERRSLDRFGRRQQAARDHEGVGDRLSEERRDARRGRHQRQPAARRVRRDEGTVGERGKRTAPSSGLAMVGGVQRLDNERATIWEFVPPASRTHRHLRDAVAVSFTVRRPPLPLSRRTPFTRPTRRPSRPRLHLRTEVIAPRAHW